MKKRTDRFTVHSKSVGFLYLFFEKAASFTNNFCKKTVFLYSLYILLSVMSLKHINPIRIFVIYGFFVVIPAFVLFGILVHREEDKASKLVLAAFLPQVVGGIYMLCRIPEFKFIVPIDHNCIYHLCLLVSVIIFYYAARRSLIEEKCYEEETFG